MDRLIATALSLYLASACVSVSVAPIGTAPPTNDPSHSITPGKGFGLVWDQNGETVTIDTDTDIIRLVLDDGWMWDVRVDPAFLQLYQHGPLVGQGFTAQSWFYKLLRIGETNVIAQGTPNCRGATPSCDAPDRRFAVTLRAR